jgi:X-X-X-Leu-X-X-Gly heptad repeat protein
MTNRVLVAAVLASCLAACGKSQQQQQADEAAKKVEQGAQQMQQGADKMAQGAKAGSQQMAEGLAQMAQGFQQMAQGAVKTVDYEQLKALLPDVAGWTKSDVKGQQMSMPVATSHAEARYHKDDSHIDLEITDTALSQLLLAPLSMFLASGYSERSDDGFKRATKVGGQPGMEEWNVSSKRGEITAVVANRYIVKATGHDVDGIDPVRKVVEAVDVSKLAALK